MTAHAVLDSPVGPLTVVARDHELVGLYMVEQRHLPPRTSFGRRDDSVLPGVRDQLSAYFAGELQEFTVPLAPSGTPFQQQVWRALRDIPYGSTCSYADLAVAVGRATAVRAVGAANGRNPLGIVVPCHRVIGSGGALTGYGGGLERKRFLLDLESRQQPLC